MADASSAILPLICSHEVWVKVAYDWSMALCLCYCLWRPVFASQSYDISISMSTRRTNLSVFLVLMLMLMPTQFSLAYACACACACAYAYALVITRLDQHEGVEFRWLLPMLSFTRRLRSRWLPFSGFRYIKGRAQNLWVFGSVFQFYLALYLHVLYFNFF